MKISEARYRANKKWNDNNLKRVAVDVRPEVKTAWEEYAKGMGFSLSGIIKAAMDEKMEREPIQAKA